MTDDYTRVIPRDLFNEAKLLKCLGQVALLQLDWPLPQMELSLIQTQSIRGFSIRQDPSDGSIHCQNLYVYISRKRVRLHTPLNSREPYPLHATIADESVQVLTDDGKWHPDFLDAVTGPVK